ncbi:MAG TPA: thioredoxin family protein [Acidobacteriota bacterium]
MATTSSTRLELGTPAPEFALPDTEGRIVSLADFGSAPALLVMFLCNHCPFVKHIQDRLSSLCRAFQERGVAVVAISSNDAERYPEDSPARMREEKQRVGYSFPYLYDQSQAVAKAYRAECTPELYLFDRERRLVYCGQFDSSRPSRPTPVTGEDLAAAVDALLAGKPVSPEQKPAVGCSIKWKPGNEPAV